MGVRNGRGRRGKGGGREWAPHGTVGFIRFRRNASARRPWNLRLINKRRMRAASTHPPPPPPPPPPPHNLNWCVHSSEIFTIRILFIAVSLQHPCPSRASPEASLKEPLIKPSEFAPVEIDQDSWKIPERILKESWKNPERILERIPWRIPWRSPWLTHKISP